MRYQWVFYRPCGCPFGVLEAGRRPGQGGRTLTEPEAWLDFYDNETDADEARDRGITAQLMDHNRYTTDVYPHIRHDQCTHAPVPA